MPKENSSKNAENRLVRLAKCKIRLATCAIICSFMDKQKLIQTWHINHRISLYLKQSNNPLSKKILLGIWEFIVR